MLEEDELTRDHWWWRPGWSLGRSFYTWHITFGPDSPIRALVPVFAPTVSAIATMAPVTASGLHITIQGIGFTDEVDAGDIDRIVAAAECRLAARAAFTVRVGPPIVDSETIQLPIADLSPLAGIRDDLQDAIGQVWGSEHVPERGNAFNPHLTVAYSTGAASIPAIRSQLAAGGVAHVQAEDRIGAVSLIRLNRDRGAYEWTDVTRAELGR
ncbi:2'-5' RNA ligase family protein [Nocardia sp. NPDC052001]|uniref:2'-5' RNA ligase family protein n=1 Tax=Nocardia sp. NPDC052001 TaxID=3154853 RepID=UPI00343795EE